MSAQRLEVMLQIIRSLIALSVGMVVAMISLAIAFWLQAEVIDVADDTTASIISFLIPMLLGGLAAGLALAPTRTLYGLFHGLGFAAIYLLMFIVAWFRDEEISNTLALGLLGGGLLLGALGGYLGHWARNRLRRRKG